MKKEELLQSFSKDSKELAEKFIDQIMSVDEFSDLSKEVFTPMREALKIGDVFTIKEIKAQEREINGEVRKYLIYELIDSNNKPHSLGVRGFQNLNSASGLSQGTTVESCIKFAVKCIKENIEFSVDNIEERPVIKDDKVLFKAKTYTLSCE